MYLETAIFRLRHFKNHHPELVQAIKATPIALIEAAQLANRLSEGAMRGSLRLVGKIYNLGKTD